MTGATARLAIEVDARTEEKRRDTEDPDHERQREQACADDGRRRAGDAPPARERVLERPREHALAVQRRTQLAGPLRMRVVAQLEEKLELLGEELVVVVQVE